MCVGSAPAREAYELALERWSAGRFDWSKRSRPAKTAGQIRLSVHCYSLEEEIDRVAQLLAVG